MTFFNYIYYRVYSLYKNKWKDDAPKLYAVALVSLMQGFNLGIIFILGALFLGVELEFKRIYYLITFTILVIFNGVWYNWFKTYEKLSLKWNYEIKTKKVRNGFLIVVYIIISFILYFLSAILYSKS